MTATVMSAGTTTGHTGHAIIGESAPVGGRGHVEVATPTRCTGGTAACTTTNDCTFFRIGLVIGRVVGSIVLYCMCLISLLFKGRTLGWIIRIIILELIHMG